MGISSLSSKDTTTSTATSGNTNYTSTGDDSTNLDNITLSVDDFKLDGIVLPLPSNRRINSTTSTLLEVRPQRRLSVLYIPSYNTSSSSDSISEVTVFLVHGSMATYKQYYGIINGLISCDYNIVAYDYYGCGDSDKPHHRDAYTTSNHHEDLLALYTKYATNRNVLIGHSYGTAQIARLIDKLHKSGVTNSSNTKVVLLGTAYELPSGGHPIFKLPVCILSLLSSYLSKQFVAIAFSSKTTDTIKAISSSISGKNDMTICKYFYTQFEWVTSSEWCSLNTYDVLIVQGKDDMITSEDNSNELYHFLKNKSTSDSTTSNGNRIVYNVIDDCGHMMLLEKADTVTSTIINFLKTNSDPYYHRV